MPVSIAVFLFWCVFWKFWKGFLEDGEFKLHVRILEDGEHMFDKVKELC